MFDFGVGYSELFVLGLIAVILIGPKDLPKVMRMIGQVTRKMRGMAREFQGHLDAAMKDSGVEELKKDFQAAKSDLQQATGKVTAPPTSVAVAPVQATPAVQAVSELPPVIPSTPAAAAPKFPVATAAHAPSANNDFNATFGEAAVVGETRVAGHLVEHAVKPGA
jgi:sec-independent protein translocase protein TatB